MFIQRTRLTWTGLTKQRLRRHRRSSRDVRRNRRLHQRVLLLVKVRPLAVAVEVVIVAVVVVAAVAVVVAAVVTVNAVLHALFI